MCLAGKEPEQWGAEGGQDIPKLYRSGKALKNFKKGSDKTKFAF